MKPRLGTAAALPVAISVALLAAADWGAYGLFSVTSIALCCLSGIALALAVWTSGHDVRGSFWRAAAPLALGVSAGLTLLSADAAYGPAAARYLFTAAPILAVGTLVPKRGFRIGALSASGMFALAAGIIQIRQVPRSGNDVWWIMQSATGHLFTQNPYTHCLPFDPQRDTQCVFPYPPGIAVVEWPFHLLFGDVRYGYLAAAGALALVILFEGGVAAAPWAAIAFTYPRFLYELNQAWTEPVLAVLLVAAVVAGRRRRRWTAIFLLALALACKQHLIFVLPLAAVWPVIGVTGVLAAIGIAALICLPWALAGPAAMWHDVVTFHYTLPPRYDSLSIPSWLHYLGGPTFPTWLSLLATVVVIVLVARRVRGGSQALLLGAAFVLWTFDVTSKVAFFNHYLLILLLMVSAVPLLNERAPNLPRAFVADPEVRLASEAGLR